jgi:hypothetical protein
VAKSEKENEQALRAARNLSNQTRNEQQKSMLLKEVAKGATNKACALQEQCSRLASEFNRLQEQSRGRLAKTAKHKP